MKLYFIFFLFKLVMGNPGWVYNQSASLRAGSICGTDQEFPCAPDFWKYSYPICGGDLQSPIDIVKSNLTVSTNLSNLQLVSNKTCEDIKLVNNGHAWQVNLDCQSSFQLEWEGKYFFMKQFHFHSPSEHTIDGQKYDAEVHLVHVSDDEEFLVLGVLLVSVHDFPLNNFFSNLMTENFTLSGNSYSTEESIDPYARCLPKSRSYYTYLGSLTTPPCSEGVRWILMKDVLAVDSVQLTRMQNILRYKTFNTQVSDRGMNARPLQNINSREVLFHESTLNPFNPGSAESGSFLNAANSTNLKDSASSQWTDYFSLLSVLAVVGVLGILFTTVPLFFAKHCHRKNQEEQTAPYQPLPLGADSRASNFRGSA